MEHPTIDEPTRYYLRVVDTDGDAFTYYVKTEDEIAAVTVAVLSGAPFILLSNEGQPTLINTAHIVVATRMTEAEAKAL